MREVCLCCLPAIRQDSENVNKSTRRLKNGQNFKEFLDECEVSAGSDTDREHLVVGPPPYSLRWPAAASRRAQSSAPSLSDFGDRIFTVGTWVHGILDCVITSGKGKIVTLGNNTSPYKEMRLILCKSS